ncbi:MAG: hypothetical protein JHC12_00155 [Thermogladius sp.]|nr:hypothetical protein [Thermogladius sp.]
MAQTSTFTVTISPSPAGYGITLVLEALFISAIMGFAAVGIVRTVRLLKSRFDKND